VLIKTEVLEKILLDGEGNKKLPGNENGCIYHASLLLAKELQPQTGLFSRALNGDQNAREQLQSCADPDSLSKDTNQSPETNGPSRKRKRGGSHEPDQIPIGHDETSSCLPSHEILSATIDAFFSSTHHWIPFLHPFRFRRDIEDTHKRPKLEIILHAIVYASMHRLDLDQLDIQQSDIEHHVELSKNTVILNAFDSLTVENVQALIIVAFTAVSLHLIISLLLLMYIHRL
jgi:hypothetical protein